MKALRKDRFDAVPDQRGGNNLGDGSLIVH